MVSVRIMPQYSCNASLKKQKATSLYVRDITCAEDGLKELGQTNRRIKYIYLHFIERTRKIGGFILGRRI